MNSGLCSGGPLDSQTLTATGTSFPQYHFADLAESSDGTPARTLLGTYEFSGGVWTWTLPT